MLAANSTQSAVLDLTPKALADHLWLHVGRRLAAVDPRPGDVLTLTGRVRMYTRRRTQVGAAPIEYYSDLGLVYPTRCAVVTRAPVPADPVPSVSPATYVTPNTRPPTNRARVLFALADLSVGAREGVSLPNLNARACVPTPSLLAQLKKLGNAGIVRFTPTGRVLLTNQPTLTTPEVAP